MAFGQRNGWPMIAKTSRGGYDGKGVWKLDGPDEAGVPFAGLRPDAVVIAEEFIDFTRELSVLVARRPGGQAVVYPVSETVQTDGICTATTTPAPGLRPDQVRDLQAMGLRIAQELGVVGILAVELMQAADGSVVVNELAMRPHNTGHWSIDGAVTSQFENHLRAVADLPLGSTALTAPVPVMVNVLGGSRARPARRAGRRLRRRPRDQGAVVRQGRGARTQGRPRHGCRRRPRTDHRTSLAGSQAADGRHR